MLIVKCLDACLNSGLKFFSNDHEPLLELEGKVKIGHHRWPITNVLLILAAMRSEERPRGQVTKLVSGDDLGDDFMAEDIYSGEKEKSSKSKDITNAKPKRKQQAPKVVNF